MDSEPASAAPIPRPALAPVAGASNASPGTPQPAPTVSAKLSISSLLSGPPGLEKENASSHPAPVGAASVIAKTGSAASKKRKAAPVDEASVDLDDYVVEDLPMTENCDQIRRKINRMLDAGGMTKTAFAAAIGVSAQSLHKFLGLHGPYKGANSSAYDNSWSYFKKRELAGLKLPVKKVAKLTKTDDAAVAAAADPESTSSPSASATTAAAASSSAPTPATTKAPAVKKTAKACSASVDISNVHLDGEDDDAVPIYDSCDEVRRKINAHLKLPGVTQAQFCRDVLAQLKSAKRPSNIQSTQLARFRGMKGAMAGASHNVFYGAYVFFEKVRIAEGKPKTKHRLDMEAAWGEDGGISRESDRGGYYCLVGERPVMDRLGKVDYIRD